MDKQQIEFETKIAFLEQHVNEMSDAVYAQQKMIDDLERKYQLLMDKMLASDEEGISIEDHKPPHY